MKRLSNCLLLCTAALFLYSTAVTAKVSSEDCAIVYYSGSEARESSDPFFDVAAVPISREMMKERYQLMLERLDTTASEFDTNVLVWLDPPKPMLHSAQALAQCDTTYGMKPVYEWHAGFGNILGQPASEAWVHALSGKHADGYNLHTLIDAASVFQLANGHWIYRYATDHSENTKLQPNARVAVIEYYQLNCAAQTQRVIYRQELTSNKRSLSTDWFSARLTSIQSGSAAAAVSGMICDNSWSAAHPRVLADDLFTAVAKIRTGVIPPL